MTAGEPRLWVVIPAAGIGRRFGDRIPKQYHQLEGKSVIEWALRPFADRADITGIVVAVADEDNYSFNDWQIDPRVRIAKGGADSESVMRCCRGLRANTLKQRVSVWRPFRRWLLAEGHTAFPTDPQQVLDYLDLLWDSGAPRTAYKSLQAALA